MGKLNFTIKSIAGLYSSGPVTVTLENTLTKRSKTFSLLEFNKLHEEGKLKVDTQGRKAHGYG